MISIEAKNGIACKCDRNFLRIAKKLMGVMGITEIKEVIKKLQETSEELAEIMGVERLVIFKIHKKDQLSEAICEIVAGTPADAHKIGFSNYLSRHPDIEMAYKNKRVTLIVDPKVNAATEHFRPTIMDNDINQILYIPLISASANSSVRGIIVLDALGDREFSDAEQSFCDCVGELISITLNHIDAINQFWKDKILNPSVGVVGISALIRKNVAKIEESANAIAEAGKKFEDMFREQGKKSF